MIIKMTGRKKQADEERPGWGGLREGAGRPTGENGPLLKTAITLDADQLAYARALGDGNLSAGLRLLIDRARSAERHEIAQPVTD